MMDLISQFRDTYKNVSKFTYMHINSGHEGTGTVIGTADSDLEYILQKLLNTTEDTLLFIKSDHGIRAGG